LSGDTIFFNLDDHCDPAAYCVGTIIPFVSNVYYDKHLEHYAGTTKGTCVAVADHPVLEFYCVFTVAVEHEGEIALQGSLADSADGTTFLITAASGSYKGEEGTLKYTPKDENITKYSFTFYESAEADEVE